MKARIDYSEELGTHRPAEFSLTDVIGAHGVRDVALFRVSRRGKKGVKAPAPLPIARKPSLSKGRQVFVVGFPAWDGHRNEPEPMQEIFKDIFNVKRLQPGEMRKVSKAQALFQHDCSTLGENAAPASPTSRPGASPGFISPAATARRTSPCCCRSSRRTSSSRKRG